jgi:hypothetical protein
MSCVVDFAPPERAGFGSASRPSRRSEAGWILAVDGSNSDDYRRLHCVLRAYRWNVCHAPTICAALLVLQARVVSVIICENELPDGRWKDLLAHVRTLQRGPRLVVASRLADDALWTEVWGTAGMTCLPGHSEPGNCSG